MSDALLYQIVTGVGANAPAVDLAAALAPDRLAAYLDYVYSEHAANVATLMARHEKFLALTDAGIDNDIMAGHAADFANALKDEAKALDDTRKKIKDPVLHAQRLIDGGAKTLSDRLTAAKATVEYRVTTWLRAKEVEERAKAEAEAKRLALAAEMAIEVANHVQTDSAADAAVLALHEAQQAEAMATAKPLELTRTRSQGGSLAGLVDRWTYEVIDLSKVPAHLLTINDAAVKLAIKQGTRDIPGLRVFNDAKAMIR